MKAPFIAAENK